MYRIFSHIQITNILTFVEFFRPNDCVPYLFLFTFKYAGPIGESMSPNFVCNPSRLVSFDIVNQNEMYRCFDSSFIQSFLT